MVATAVPLVRSELPAQLERFREHAADHPGFEAVARIHAAQEQLVRGGSAAAAVEEVQAALAVGLPAGAATNAGFLALQVLEVGEQYDQALRVLDVALKAPVLRAMRRDRGSSMGGAPRSRSPRARCRTRRSRPRPGCCSWKAAFRPASAPRGGDGRAHRARRPRGRGRAGANR